MDNDEPVYEAQYSLLNAYFNKLKENFSKLPNRSRSTIISNLEKLAESTSPEKIAKVKDQFDYEKAREIRESLKLTRKELKKTIGVAHEITLYKYETGKLIPNSHDHPKYFAWLEKNGYPSSR